MNPVYQHFGSMNATKLPSIRSLLACIYTIHKGVALAAPAIGSLDQSKDMKKGPIDLLLQTPDPLYLNTRTPVSKTLRRMGMLEESHTDNRHRIRQKMPATDLIEAA